MEGKWIVEGRGVEPDIDVVADPAQMARGVDSQLERAIQEVMKEIETAPRPPRAPAYPKRTAPMRTPGAP